MTLWESIDSIEEAARRLEYDCRITVRSNGASLKWTLNLWPKSGKGEEFEFDVYQPSQLRRKMWQLEHEGKVRADA